MQAMDNKGEVLSTDTFDNTNELKEAFASKLQDENVKTIRVTTDIKSSNTITPKRKNIVEKKIRKLERKFAEYQMELEK